MAESSDCGEGIFITLAKENSFPVDELRENNAVSKAAVGRRSECIKFDNFVESNLHNQLCILVEFDLDLLPATVAHEIL